MRVMLDLEDVFIPLPTDLIFVDPHESRYVSYPLVHPFVPLDN
jgi:hypothetical protein